MSAFVVTDLHIHTILATVAQALRGRGNLYVEADAPGMGAPQYDLTDIRVLTTIGLVLATQNERSVDHRYRMTPGVARYAFKAVPATTPVAALKLIQSLAYQSCETDDWRSTLARRILDAMTETLITRLPGYEAAPWCVDEIRRAPVAA